ncbi:protein OS-9 [Latimeria chalumnae]|uniref:protein OS-9 n=1 Tax=Latimeria chalumnae TaxID=7897 RepID=UPI0006D8F257|nr:PREDICTED: protein OS-9 [Latimeria chalumnae]|eukprot:XP_014352231.1 PREDICTED: protein OS-9 [Latimeria chalumnae]
MAASIAARDLLVCFFSVFLLSVAAAFLNIEELNEVKYGIEIMSEPVIRGQSKSADVVVISSKYKQQYECRLPAQAMKFHQDAGEDAQGYLGAGISQLLKPMDAAPCLIKTKDWWTYEFCYGKHIRQYHVEDAEIRSPVIYLGHFESEFDWNNETAKASKHHRLKRYHSQSYVNGSKCDLNSKPREAEVRFMCEEGSGDYIARVDEPQSCSYVLTVHTTRICHHPYLRPPSVARPQPIKCYPTLSPEQYVEYVKAQVSDTKRKVEQISEELKNLDEILAKDQETANGEEKSPVTQERESYPDTQEADVHREDDLVQTHSETTGGSSGGEEEEEGNIEDGDDDFWNKAIKPEGGDPAAQDERVQAESEESDVQTLVDDKLGQDFENQKFHFQVIRNPDDLVKFIHKLKTNTKKKAEKETRKDSEGRETDTAAASETPPKERKLSKDSDEDVDIEEFEKELQDVFLPKSELSEIKQEVKAEMEKEFDNIIEEAQEELEAEGLKGEFDRNQASKNLASTLNKLIDKLGDTETPSEEESSSSTDQTQGSPGNPATSADDEEADGRVKIRVTKIKTGSALHKEMKLREVSNEDPQKLQLENMVKERLEKAGLKAEGKIEVKIVTSGSFGDDDDGHWLSEEDTRSFRDLFVSLLTGGTEEAYKEQQRQQQLEDNYRFVWGKPQEETQTTNTDSDDMDF